MIQQDISPGLRTTRTPEYGTCLNLTNNREEQVLTEALLCTESDEDESGDQVK